MLGGAGVFSTIGSVGIAGSFGAFSIGMGTMAAAGGIFGLGIYGLAKMLDQGTPEPAAQVFARMEDKILWQEAYVEALNELLVEPFLAEYKLKQRFIELEVEEELQNMKRELSSNSKRNSDQEFLEPAVDAELESMKREFLFGTGSEQFEQIKPEELALSAKVWLQTHILKHHAGSINAISVSADGQTFATAGDDKIINLWNFNTGKRLSSISGSRQAVLAVAISPDSQTIASGGVDQAVTSWNLKTRAYLNTFLPMGSAYSHASFVYSLAFSPDGKTLVSGGADNTIRIWRYDHRSFITEKLKRTLNGHTDTVFSVAVSSDGKTVVSGSADKTIRVWNLLSWSQPRVMTGHLGWVNSVAFNPDGQTIVSGSADATVKLWDLATGTLLHTLTECSAAITSVAISADGRTIASSSKDGMIRLWQFNRNQNLYIERLHTLPGCGHVAFSPDSKTLICGCENGIVKVWKLTN